jgi:16S rRNA (guanine527-N7)-methyltransferase
LRLIEFEKFFIESTKGQFQPDPFYRYLQLLLKWNAKINLVSSPDPKIILDRHLLDSLQLVPYIAGGEALLDIGSGAGFPGIPLAIAVPGIRVTLAESIKKKVDFLKSSVRDLKLGNVSIIHGRIGPESQIGPYDIIVSRGTVSLAKLVPLSLPFLKEEGRIISLKGKNVEAEVAELGERGKYAQIIPYRLPISGLERSIVVVQRG